MKKQFIRHLIMTVLLFGTMGLLFMWAANNDRGYVEDMGNAYEAEPDLQDLYVHLGVGEYVPLPRLVERPFPVLRIYTENRQPVNSREIWVNAEFSLENLPEEHAFANASGRMRGRGNSTWYMHPKQSFRIRFDDRRTMAGTDHAARNWVIIGNHADKSLLRNHAAYYFAGLLDGMYYAPLSKFIDVYINGDYRGVYMLSDHQNVEAGRVQLTFDEDPAISEFFLEMCSRRADEGGEEGIHFVTINRRHYDIRFPRDELHTRDHAEYVRYFLSRFEYLARSGNERVFDYIHLQSFIDFYIVQEWFKNQDVGFASVFMQIRGQGEDRRLEMGPVWDFDIAAGNAYYAYARLGGYFPHGIWAREMNRWFFYLMRMPTFYNAVHDRWREIRHTKIPATIDRINHMANTYRLGFERNFERWNIMGRWVWPNPRRIYLIDTFMGQVDNLTNFLELRAAWLDEYFILNRP